MWDVLKEYPTARIRLEAIATKRLEKYKTDPSPDDKLEGELKTTNCLNTLNITVYITTRIIRIIQLSTLFV